MQIKRKVNLTTAIAIVIANMIGTGIFTTTGILANYLPNSIWILFCWLLGGIIAISGAISYTELATRMPEVGGEYVYLKKLYHPVVGFLSGWTSFFVGFSAPIAGAAISFAAYFLAGINFEDIEGFLSAEQIQKAIAISIIILFTSIHYFGIKFGSIIQNCLSLIKVVIVLGLSLAGIFFGSGDFSYSSEINTTYNLGDFGIAMMIVMFSYSGWNASTYIAGELVNPKKNLLYSLLIGTSVVVVLYLLLNFFILNEIPFDEIKNTIAVVEKATTHSFGNGLGSLFSLLVGIALLSSLSAFMIIGPRVYYAMALDKLFFSFASIINKKYEVPGYSIIIQGLLASFMVLVGSFEQLLIYIGFSLNIFPWLAVFGLFIARKRKIGEETAVKTWGYPIVPIFYLLSCLLIMIVAFFHKPIESSIATITVAVGIPIYYFLIKTKKHQ
jgi:APA family basic amino acid/polyamine antiporter